MLSRTLVPARSTRNLTKMVELPGVPALKRSATTFWSTAGRGNLTSFYILLLVNHMMGVIAHFILCLVSETSNDAKMGYFINQLSDVKFGLTLFLCRYRFTEGLGIMAKSNVLPGHSGVTYPGNLLL